MTSVIFNAPDISCEHCERAITGALSLVDGVRSVSVDIAAKQVNVEHDHAQLNIDKMNELLNEVDYPVESVL